MHNQKIKKPTIGGMKFAMKRLIIDILRRFLFFFLPILAILAKVISFFVRDNEAFNIFSKYDLYLLRKHYYVPIPEKEDCTEEFWNSDSKLVGITIDEEKILSYMETELVRYNEEFSSYPINKEKSKGGYYLLNGRFMAIDGNIYYSLIRQIKPKIIFEIGCGFSTMLASDAIQKNRVEGAKCKLICVDPYPPSVLKNESLEIDEWLKKKVQLVEIKRFKELRADDILFIDSSHVLRTGGDVQYLYCEVLPRLHQGVLIHIHDISLPKQYPKVYYENCIFWNEQYLLQAFLTYNSRIEVIWPGNYMMLKQPEKVSALFPEYAIMRDAYPSSEPTSFWLRVK